MTKGQRSFIQNAMCLQNGSISIKLQATLGRTMKLTSSYLVTAQTRPRSTCSHNLLNSCKSRRLSEMSFLLIKISVG